jgi:pyruvate dehydrogenase E1 component
LLGATSGKTTLGGEGLQHQDGSSHIMAATVPNCRAYDPSFAYEVAVILEHGMKQMLEEQEDTFYYMTLLNENYDQPSQPEGVEEDIIRGAYCYTSVAAKKPAGTVKLLGSGSLLPEVIKAAHMLADEWQISSEIWSVTSYSELAREAREVVRWNRLNPKAKAKQHHVAACFDGDSPVVAVSDYMRAVPQLISEYVAAPFTTLGTDGFGRSDTRPALRSFFEVDRFHIALAAAHSLVAKGEAKPDLCARIIKAYDIDTTESGPWNN